MWHLDTALEWGEAPPRSRSDRQSKCVKRTCDLLILFHRRTCLRRLALQYRIQFGIITVLIPFFREVLPKLYGGSWLRSNTTFCEGSILMDRNHRQNTELLKKMFFFWGGGIYTHFLWISDFFYSTPLMTGFGSKSKVYVIRQFWPRAFQWY